MFPIWAQKSVDNVSHKCTRIHSMSSVVAQLYFFHDTMYFKSAIWVRRVLFIC